MKEVPNLKYLDELAGNDEMFRKKFIGILKEEFPREVHQYEDNIKASCFKEASLDVHKIKHKINVLGLNGTHQLAVVHEAELRKGENFHHDEFMMALKGIESYLKTI